MASGGNPLITPIIANNPAFKVNIVPIDGRLEQKPGAKDGAAEQAAIKVGDTIKGEVLSQTREHGEHVVGKVVAIDQDNDQIIGFRVVTTDGEEVTIDPTTAQKAYTNGESTPNRYMEPDMDKQVDFVAFESMMSYSEWLAESKKS
jgi:hypothetical protein